MYIHVCLFCKLCLNVRVICAVSSDGPLPFPSIAQTPASVQAYAHTDRQQSNQSNKMFEQVGLWEEYVALEVQAEQLPRAQVNKPSIVYFYIFVCYIYICLACLCVYICVD